MATVYMPRGLDLKEQRAREMSAAKQRLEDMAAEGPGRENGENMDRDEQQCGWQYAEGFLEGCSAVGGCMTSLELPFQAPRLWGGPPQFVKSGGAMRPCQACSAEADAA